MSKLDQVCSLNFVHKAKILCCSWPKLLDSKDIMYKYRSALLEEMINSKKNYDVCKTGFFCFKHYLLFFGSNRYITGNKVLKQKESHYSVNINRSGFRPFKHHYFDANDRLIWKNEMLFLHTVITVQNDILVCSSMESWSAINLNQPLSVLRLKYTMCSDTRYAT